MLMLLCLLIRNSKSCMLSEIIYIISDTVDEIVILYSYNWS